MKIRKFTDLLAWQEAHQLAILVYELTKGFPTEEKYGLVSQMRRASISVTSNIAEGFGRRSYKEKTNFYYISQGSLVEIKNQALLARDVHILSENDWEKYSKQSDQAHRLLQGLIKSTKNGPHA